MGRTIKKAEDRLRNRSCYEPKCKHAKLKPSSRWRFQQRGHDGTIFLADPEDKDLMR
jgi:hypothetical protein